MHLFTSFICRALSIFLKDMVLYSAPAPGDSDRIREDEFRGPLPGQRGHLASAGWGKGGFRSPEMPLASSQAELCCSGGGDGGPPLALPSSSLCWCHTRDQSHRVPGPVYREYLCCGKGEAGISQGRGRSLKAEHRA